MALTGGGGGFVICNRGGSQTQTPQRPGRNLSPVALSRTAPAVVLPPPLQLCWAPGQSTLTPTSSANPTPLRPSPPAPVSAQPTLTMWYGCSSRGSILSFMTRANPQHTGRCVWNARRRGTKGGRWGCPSLAPELINFSQVEREMEAEHTAGVPFLNSSSWGLPGHSLGFGGTRRLHIQRTRGQSPHQARSPVAVARYRLCSPSGLDRTGQPRAPGRGLLHASPNRTARGRLQTHLCDEWGSVPSLLTCRGHPRGPGSRGGAASCRGSHSHRQIISEQMQLACFTTKEAGPRFSPENQGARHARWPSSHLCANLYPLTVSPLPSKQMVMIRPPDRELSRRL